MPISFLQCKHSLVGTSLCFLLCLKHFIMFPVYIHSRYDVLYRLPIGHHVFSTWKDPTVHFDTFPILYGALRALRHVFSAWYHPRRYYNSFYTESVQGHRTRCFVRLSITKCASRALHQCPTGYAYLPYRHIITFTHMQGFPRSVFINLLPGALPF